MVNDLLGFGLLVVGIPVVLASLGLGMALAIKIIIRVSTGSWNLD